MFLKKISIAVGLAVAASQLMADSRYDRSSATNFDNFKPLLGNTVAGTLPESAPFRLSSDDFRQVNIVTRDTQQLDRFDSGNYDMHTVNENGPEKGTFLFTVFETDQAGIQRTDLRTMQTTTIWQAENLGEQVAFDASRWTPWGSFLTGEESWSDPGQAVSPYGRLYEVTNPLAAPADIVIKQRNILPRVSHEGLAFDKDNNLYFIDERNGSHIFRFKSRNPRAKSGDEYFSAGETSVLRVGDGTVKEATGKAKWIPLTDKNGNPLPGAILVYGTEIDGRATPKLTAFLGTGFDRPEDLEISSPGKNDQLLFVATTTNHNVFSINLKKMEVKLFASRATRDLATDLAAGDEFTNPDNLAIDADGNIYIVEDQPGGVEDTWFTVDKNHDGVAEAMGKWASLNTAGAEATGLYFDPFNPHLAYINVQHPDSGEDRTMMLMAPAVTGYKYEHD
jgi:secreted PhoX family phosphatase